MKRFIVNILIFFAFVVTFDIVLGYVGDYLTNHVKSGDTRRTNNLVMRDCHDVLILGSSRARHHYDAPFLSDTLGLDVYNAGYDGNGVILAYGLLQLILERYQPKLILYDVTPAFDINVYEPDNNHKRYISRLKPYYRHYAVGGIIKDVSTEEWLKVQSGMVRYNMSLLTMFMDNYRSSNDTMKGYSPLEGVYDRVPNHDEVTSVVDSFKLEYIKKLITLTKNKQIPLVLVASPKLGSISSEQMQPVRDICKQTKVEFVDYYANTEFMQHNEWFKEPMHLNKEGARKYSKEMVSIILELLNNN